MASNTCSINRGRSASGTNVTIGRGDSHRGEVGRFNGSIASTAPSASARRRRSPVGPLVAVALVASLVLTACSDDGGGQATDDALPTATLIDLQSEEAAAWPEGTPLVINLWASWCTPCRKEMPAFEEVSQEVEGEVTIVGVTDETDLDAARDAAEQAGVTYPLLVDEGQTVLVDLEVTGLPGTVFVDEDGTILERHLGAMTATDLTNAIEEHYG